MPSKLKNLVITKVALVDEGSCSAAHIKLYKRKEGGNEVMTFEELMKSIPEDQQALINDEISKAKAELPEGALSADDAKALNDKATQAEIDKTATLDELNTLKKAKTQNDEEELMKNLDPAVRAIVEKAQGQAAAANAVILKMKDDADEAEALAKAKELPNIGAKEEDLAKSLKSLKGKDEALFGEIFDVLKAADELVKSSAAFRETGGGDNGGTDEELAKAADAAWVKIEKKADEVMKADNCTKEAAITKVMRSEPELYNEYLKNLK